MSLQGSIETFFRGSHWGCTSNVYRHREFAIGFRQPCLACVGRLPRPRRRDQANADAAFWKLRTSNGSVPHVSRRSTTRFAFPNSRDTVFESSQLYYPCRLWLAVRYRLFYPTDLKCTAADDCSTQNTSFLKLRVQ